MCKKRLFCILTLHKRMLMLSLMSILCVVSAFGQIIIEMPPQGKVYSLPGRVNGLELNFIFDTGASDVYLSMTEAVFMLKNGYLKEKDIKGTNYYSTATGEIREGTVINLPEVRVGDVVLKNIEASVSHSQQAPLLLGQSVLERFGTVTIDNINSKLIIKTFGD